MTDRPGLTPEALDTIEARANAATKGPWFREYNLVQISGPHEESSSIEWDAAEIAHCGKPHDRRDSRRIKDAEFIAHAREDIPALVVELRRLRTENVRLIQSREILEAKITAALTGEVAP